ncbi:DUF3710 domain-containing protein [Corynebacterium epidermidicanis]|uniref:Putative DUF3710 family protein n=1 Tax=Corynebacterium epidermidicanis TaxID=1050174 RepID=A0A0G3GUU7_9CORY|nr:DUF3710 domain-containing protein [Corynebacterium epidermidicanis]AKK03303.1 putative DUF3710 family protein [Corynebacterium epidermidicanis]
MWPFSKKNDEEQPNTEPTATHVVANPADAAREDASTQPDVDKAPEIHDGQERGPFDGDSINYDDFDFSDFSVGTLDLGSMKIAMPNPSEVQVEMGEEGPRMLHIVTQFGRITPVAFAAPRSGGVWAESVPEIVAGMSADGLAVTTEQGPWGEEVVGSAEHATIRIFGVDGPRWTLRFTLAAPNDRATDLAQLGREVAARSFVYRGETPMLSGAVLPVTMPSQLVAQVQEAMMQRADAPAPTTSETPQPNLDAERQSPVAQTPAVDSDVPGRDSGSAVEQMRQRQAVDDQSEQK